MESASPMDDVVAFGLTVEQISDFGLQFLFVALILYMIFIIINLVRESKAGAYGAMWLFLALGLGFVGFITKELLLHFWKIGN